MAFHAPPQHLPPQNNWIYSPYDSFKKILLPIAFSVEHCTNQHNKASKVKQKKIIIIIRNKETKLSLFKVSIIIPTKKEANHKILVIDYGLNTI